MKNLHLEINNQYEGLACPQATTLELFATLIESGKFPIGGGELSIAFVDDATIAQVHADYMSDPSPTDVITFPADPSMDAAGEIIVSVDHARSRAEELGEAFSRELSLYLVHGWLHLAGFDDKAPADREKMRAAEQEALALLDVSGKALIYRLKETP